MVPIPPSTKPLNCTSATKGNERSNENLFQLKGQTGSDCGGDGDADLSNRSNRSWKGLKNIHSPRTDNNDNDESTSLPSKLRISSKIMEREPSVATSIQKITSLSSSESASSDIKSINFNIEVDVDDDKNESNDSETLNERLSENIDQPIYHPAANEYLVHQQFSIQPPPQQRIYDEHQMSQHFEHQQYQQTQYSGVVTPAEENSNCRQRKERMSKRQKELYVEFLEENPLLNKHRRNDPILDIFWLRLANILNSCPNGAAKSVAEWKQAFDNWRYRVFLYARHNSQLNKDDTTDLKAFKPLTRTDKRAYNMWIRNPDTAPANTGKLPNDFVCSED